MGFGGISELVTVHSYDINDTFADEASLIGGAVTINGIVLLAYQVDTEGDDEGGWASLYINGIACDDGGGFSGDGDCCGLMASKNGGAAGLGMLTTVHERALGFPHTSFDVRNYQGSSKLFHRTVKVVVLNRA